MDRPDCVVLDVILATVDEIRDVEARLAALKVRLSSEVAGLSQITDKALRLRAGVYAYWFAAEVNANELGLATTGRSHPAKMLKGADAVSINVACHRCHRDLPIRSRTHMRDIQRSAAEGWPLECDECRDTIDADRQREIDEEAHVLERRSIEVARMPYADYLQTDEWVRAREAYLWGSLQADSSGLKCEGCAAEEALVLVHRTLRDVGRNDDLALLCERCAAVLVLDKKLVSAPGPANRVDRRYLDRIEGAAYVMRDLDEEP